MASHTGNTISSTIRDMRNIIVISSVVPAPTSAASLTMYRHLVEHPGFNLLVFSGRLTHIRPDSFSARILTQLQKMDSHRLFEDLEFVFSSCLMWEKYLPAPSELKGPAAVLTLAHGNGWWVARRYAKRYKLPLVVRFDDWWPDVVCAHTPVRVTIERSFKALHQDSDCAICISEGMHQALGPHRNAKVIFPIPRNVSQPATIPPPSPPLRVCYLGNMSDYGPMLASLVEQIDSDHIWIEFRGHEPRWPESLKNQLRREGRLHEFATGPEFQVWFESFHVYLVCMFFEEVQRRRVETCFATKLAEYTSLGRPIIIWAPESAAVVRWALIREAALCVTSPDPGALVNALYQLAADPVSQVQLGAAARRAYETDFNPSRLQNAFVSAIDSVLYPVDLVAAE